MSTTDRYRDTELAARLEEEVALVRIRREAKRIVDAEERPSVEWPRAVLLDEWLSEPDEGDDWRIDGWWPTAGNMMLVAQAKVGKTTAVTNLIRALVDGEPFLGRDAVRPVSQGRVVLLDFEMAPRMLKRWYRQAAIRNPGRVAVLPMRGQAAAFDLHDDEVRGRWAEQLRELNAEVLIWDCLNPVVTALGLDENREVSPLLNQFTALLRDLGEIEGLVVHHAGHTAERARGDSGMMGWGDGWWKLMLAQDASGHHGARYISAYGRSVDQAEAQLSLDPETGRLTIAGGSRRSAKLAAACQAVEEILSASEEPLTKRDIEAGLDARGVARAAGREAISSLVALGQVEVEPGPNRSILHRFAGVPECADGVPADPCAGVPPPLRAAHAHTTSEGEGVDGEAAHQLTEKQRAVLEKITRRDQEAGRRRDQEAGRRPGSGDLADTDREEP